MAPEPEHLDPTRVPPWLMEAAAKTSPDAMGWLVSGYLSGVEVARKAGPCGAQLMLTVDGLLTVVSCDRVIGHFGDHERVWLFIWATPGETP